MAEFNLNAYKALHKEDLKVQEVSKDAKQYLSPHEISFIQEVGFPEILLDNICIYDGCKIIDNNYVVFASRTEVGGEPLLALLLRYS